MPSIDVVLESQDIVVLGGPTNIEVQLDTGATGTRGSLAYAGSGLPSSSTIPNYSSILPGDLYINISPGANYSWLYQYLVKPAGNTWEPIVQLNPTLYNKIHTVAFTDGSATLSIPLTNITSSYSLLTPDNFEIQLTFENDNPISFSISGKQIVSTDLSLTIAAAEFDGAAWSMYNDTNARICISIRVISISA